MDGIIKIWDAESGGELLTLAGYAKWVENKYSPNGRGPSWVDSVAYSPDRHRIASGSADNTVTIWGME